MNAREAKVAASEGEAVKVIVSAKADAQVMLDDARGYADRVRTDTQEALEITRKGVESIFSDALLLLMPKQTRRRESSWQHRG